LDDQRFFSRALVNRVWRQLLGYGLVEPVDQMHSANEPADERLLEWLAGTFAVTGYDIRLLVETIVLTEAYQLSSRWESEQPLPAPEAFAVARLRPLDRKSLTFSLLLATGDGRFDADPPPSRLRAARLLGVPSAERVTDYLEMEQEAAPLRRFFDVAEEGFQSSAAEALFVSNAESFQRLVRADGENLAARLAELDDTQATLRAAFRTILSRPPDSEEQERLGAWFDERREERRAACEQLVWALVSSAEFRFNH
jgi:hypothetical protein